jgi:hypothetical protein
MIGVTFSRYIARVGRLAQMSPGELRESMTSVLRTILQENRQGPRPCPVNTRTTDR